jgi:hypothetical protein
MSSASILVHIGPDGSVLGVGPSRTGNRRGASGRRNGSPDSRQPFLQNQPPCPANRNGHHDFVEEYTCTGIMMAVFCFPGMYGEYLDQTRHVYIA